MRRTSQYLAILVLILGVVGVVIGSVFIAQAVEKENWIKGAMQEEKITLGLSSEQIAKGEIIDTPEGAQAAADTIREHRRGTAKTYNELLAGGRFDPTNPKHVTYMQALNLENYLYLSVASFGLINVVMASGGFMIIMGIGLGIIGVVLFGLARRIS